MRSVVRIPIGLYSLLLVCFLFSCSKNEDALNKNKSQINLLTTDSRLATDNLEAEITSLNSKMTEDPDALSFRIRLVSLLLLKTSFFSEYDFFDRIQQIAEDAIRINPKDSKSYILKAKSLSSVHRFQDALDKLQKADSLGANKDLISELQDSIYLAQGKNLNLILQRRQQATLKNKNFSTLTSLAGVESELGLFEEADQHYIESLQYYSDVSPFPVAYLYFQRGLMWSEKAGKPDIGKQFYQEALQRLPKYVDANIHLAEIEYSEGRAEQALARLQTISDSTDPEVAGLMTRIERHLSHLDNSEKLKANAEKRYLDLLRKMYDAFSDHAAEFYLNVKEDPQKALTLAQDNLMNRSTDRAYYLAILTARAAHREDLICTWISNLKAREIHLAPLKTFVQKNGCQP